jgi:mannose-6-phosphate isomerase-like protein (cupin superfamily)
VVEGRVEITLNGKTTAVKAGDPAVLVPRRAVHSVKGFKGEKLIFREKPDPAGIYKAL